MALTITKFFDQGFDAWGATDVGLFNITGDTSYPAGGYAVTAQQFSFRLLAGIDPIGNNTAAFGVSPLYNTTTQKIQLLGVAPGSAGLPLTLGTVTGTSTLSACTAANLVTVTAPNTLVAGQFVVFQGSGNGNIAKANGQLVEISAATASTFSFTWAGIGGTVASAADTTALAYPVVTASGGLVTAGTATGTPTTTVLTSNVGTITVANSFIPGQLVLLNGFTNAATLNGYVVQVVTASSTSFTFNLNIANVTTGSETTGSVIPMVAPGSAPIITGNSAAITNSVLTSNVVSLSAVQDFPINALVMIQGLTNGAALNGYTGTVLASGLTNALFKYNFNHANISTGADAGVAATLIVGGTSTPAELAAGTNVSSYTWLVLAISQR
jgi:hypothetical protein